MWLWLEGVLGLALCLQIDVQFCLTFSQEFSFSGRKHKPKVGKALSNKNNNNNKTTNFFPPPQNPLPQNRTESSKSKHKWWRALKISSVLNLAQPGCLHTTCAMQFAIVGQKLNSGLPTTEDAVTYIDWENVFVLSDIIRETDLK